MLELNSSQSRSQSIQALDWKYFGNEENLREKKWRNEKIKIRWIVKKEKTNYRSWESIIWFWRRNKWPRWYRR